MDIIKKIYNIFKNKYVCIECSGNITCFYQSINMYYYKKGYIIELICKDCGCILSKVISWEDINFINVKIAGS